MGEMQQNSHFGSLILDAASQVYEASLPPQQLFTSPPFKPGFPSCPHLTEKHEAKQ